jgi:hypothetical protein
VKKVLLLFVLLFFTIEGSVTASIVGDIDADGDIDLSDVISCLKIITNNSDQDTISLTADVNSDNKVGMSELLYDLSYLAGLRDTTPTGFTAEMLNASPTYYVTFSGDPDGTTDQGTTQEILVFSGTGPYVVTVTGEYFDASDVSQGTYTGDSANIVLNADGTLTASVSGEPGETIITLDEETATYLLVHGGEGNDSWIDKWYFAEPEGWLTSGGTPTGFTAEMLNAGPTYYTTKTGDPEGTTDQGTTQGTLVFSGTGPYVVTVTEEYFNASGVSQGTGTGEVNIVLNADGTLTASVSGEPGATIIALTAETETYLSVSGVVNDTETWDEYWFLATPPCWLPQGCSNSEYIELPSVSDFAIVTDIINLDLNDDGLEDLLLFRTSDAPFYSGLYIQALINNGDKSFLDKTDDYFSTIGNGNDWRWIDKAYLVDLNGDGLQDIVSHIDLGGSNNLPPLIRKATGAFEITTNQVLLDNAGAMIPIDSDADGDFDILLREVAFFGNETNQEQRLTLLSNTTTSADNMSFESLGVVSIDDRAGWDYSSFAYSPVAIDINADGYQDLVYGGPKWKNGGFIDEVVPLNVFINSTENTFQESSAQVFGESTPSYTHVREMIVADFYGNGQQSILIANTGYDWSPYPGQRNAIIKNDGTGALIEQIGNSDTHDYQGFTHSADAADIDNDGDVDIVYTDILGDDVVNPEKVRILLNDGIGNFSRKSFIKLSLSAYGWTATKLVDLDGDSYPELILGSMDSSSKSVVLWNDGAGNF